MFPLFVKGFSSPTELEIQNQLKLYDEAIKLHAELPVLKAIRDRISILRKPARTRHSRRSSVSSAH